MLVGVAVGGYFLYNYMQSQSAAAPAPTTGGTTPPPAAAYDEATLTALRAAMTNNGLNPSSKYNPDVMSWAWQQIAGKAAIDSSVLDVWFPAGRPADTAKYPLISDIDFATQLKAKGISGLGAPRVLMIPRVAVRDRANQFRLLAPVGGARSW